MHLTLPKQTSGFFLTPMLEPFEFYSSPVFVSLIFCFFCLFLVGGCEQWWGNPGALVKEWHFFILIRNSLVVEGVFICVSFLRLSCCVCQLTFFKTFRSSVFYIHFFVADKHCLFEDKTTALSVVRPSRSKFTKKTGVSIGHRKLNVSPEGLTSPNAGFVFLVGRRQFTNTFKYACENWWSTPVRAQEH